MQLLEPLKLFLVLSLLGVSMAQESTFRLLKIESSSSRIPLEAILSGGPPPQGIPALGFSGDWQAVTKATQGISFVSQAEASAWLDDKEPLIIVSLQGESKAYPLQILTWHEIVNDTLAGVPIAVTFCPLCNSALAFDRRIPLDNAMQTQLANFRPDLASRWQQADQGFKESYQAQLFKELDPKLATLEVTFGVSGLLYNSNLLMFDSETSSLWSQLSGEGAVGNLSQAQLLRYPAQIISFAELKSSYPQALVLSRDTGFNRDYGRNPYLGYDDAASPPFLYAGHLDERLPPKERVISLSLAGEDVAYPFSLLSEHRVLVDEVGQANIVLFWQEGTASALDGRSIATSRDVGAVGVFSAQLDEQNLSFYWDGENFRDRETESTWNISGLAVAGELAGKGLKAIIHDNTLWFAWAAFKPQTRIYSHP
ncbi:MAG: DUF3179 domain-containing protein [Deinococcales bacterium]